MNVTEIILENISSREQLRAAFSAAEWQNIFINMLPNAYIHEPSVAQRDQLTRELNNKLGSSTFTRSPDHWWRELRSVMSLPGIRNNTASQFAGGGQVDFPNAEYPTNIATARSPDWGSIKEWLDQFNRRPSEELIAAIRANDRDGGEETGVIDDWREGNDSTPESLSEISNWVTNRDVIITDGPYTNTNENSQIDNYILEWLNVLTDSPLRAAIQGNGISSAEGLAWNVGSNSHRPEEWVRQMLSGGSDMTQGDPQYKAFIIARVRLIQENPDGVSKAQIDQALFTALRQADRLYNRRMNARERD